MEALIMVALEGIRVLDFSEAAAGPFCSQLLGDMGAEVIKVEKAGEGDRSRVPFVVSIDGESTNFFSFNRNKKSITLNLKSEKGREIVLKLVERVDVFLQNSRPDAFKRLGLDYATLSQINPRLVYCAISGFGQTGPYGPRRGQDVIAQALGGLMSLTGEKGRQPIPAGGFIVDMATAMLSAYGILCALMARTHSGRGQEVNACLLDSALILHTFELTHFLNTASPPERGGTGHWLMAPPYGTYATKDSHICTTSIFRTWNQFCKALNIERLENDERFVTSHARYDHREELQALLVEAFKKKTTEEWLERFELYDAMASPINTYEDVEQHSQIQHNQMIIGCQHPVAGYIRVPGFPIKLGETPAELSMPPPLLGQHNEEILGELGYTNREIGEFMEQGIV
jgi:crotonobetainyl-CoA:carnitine CoA-transferase CaiB-like acyl-CoA transferase